MVHVSYFFFFFFLIKEEGLDVKVHEKEIDDKEQPWEACKHVQIHLLILLNVVDLFPNFDAVLLVDGCTQARSNKDSSCKKFLFSLLELMYCDKGVRGVCVCVCVCVCVLL